MFSLGDTNPKRKRGSRSRFGLVCAVQVLAHCGWHALNDNRSNPDDFFTPHVGTAFFLFADGSVRPVSVKTDMDIIRALATRQGGEVISPDVF